MLVLGLSCIASFTMGWISHNVFSKSTLGAPNKVVSVDTPAITSTELIVVDTPRSEAVEARNLISNSSAKPDTINLLNKNIAPNKATTKPRKLRFQFSDFPLQRTVTHKSKMPLEFRTCSSGKLYKTQTVAAVKKGMNLGGNLVFCSIPCGSYCYSSTITDLNTGKVYAGPDASTGYTFRSDSRLLIVNDPQNIDCEDCAVEYYVWIGNGFKRLK